MNGNLTDIISLPPLTLGNQSIGGGGFSRVCRATNQLDGMQYAIKQIPLNPHDIESVIQVVTEVRILARMSCHPNVVRYYSAWVEEGETAVSASMRLLCEGDEDDEGEDSSSSRGLGGRPSSYRCCVQMELCDLSLREYLNQRQEVFSPQESALFLQVLRGVLHLHENNVIHGDLKPENVLICVTAEGLVAKVSDFGLSTCVHDGHPQPSMASSDAPGTPLYTAPDRTRSTASDVYSLGVVLFEMFYCFGTGMERVVMIRKLRDANELPRRLEEERPAVFLMVKMMVVEEPSHRPHVKLLQRFFNEEPSSDPRVMCRDIVWGIVLRVLLGD